MIKQVIEGLKLMDYYDANELIQFAKGSHKAPQTFKEMREIVKRRKYGRQ
tara:strand:- start:1673 stop:1822 length:150 start_codon:yes stop_codon:yes gene_type:complete